jgi:tryptophanase
LLASVPTGIALDAINGLREAELSIEVEEEFFVTYRVKCVQMTERIQATCLIEKAVGHHAVYATVDTFIEHFAGKSQSELANTERAGF